MKMAILEHLEAGRDAAAAAGSIFEGGVECVPVARIRALTPPAPKGDAE
jgi:hypothetical protein